MQVFIDTSVFISFFRQSQSGFADLETLATGAKMRRFELVSTQHVSTEYERYREKAIADGLREFSADTIKTLFPPFVRDHTKAKDLNDRIKAIKSDLSSLAIDLIGESKTKSLLIDESISSVFALCANIGITPDIIERAAMRANLGNPPRKRNDNIGDSLNWEALLSIVRKSDLAIISADGDYASDLHKNEAKGFLRKEWSTASGKELTFYRSISSFLSANAKDFKPGDEVSADYLVAELETSESFKRTHELIDALRTAKGLTPRHVERIIDASIYNNQINLIVGDDDVQDFLVDLYEGFAGSIDPTFGEMLYELLGGGWT